MVHTTRAATLLELRSGGSLVNHIKMIKRQMFGRAELPLLRKRVLLTAAQGSHSHDQH
ncbi:hypothetical protein ABZS93_34355 [Streptomyces sp900116325]|uniref:hypothetical protein n=1 Tax=Streptomyces sp. 900116325 TaxID=3154295 RepID=UPI0033AABE95